MSSLRSPYVILGADPRCSDEELKKAFRRRALKLHPDRNPGPHAQSEMTRLLEAWERVKTPEGRAKVDAELGLKTPPQPKGRRTSKRRKQNSSGPARSGAARAASSSHRSAASSSRRGRGHTNSSWSQSTSSISNNASSVQTRSASRREQEQAAQASRSRTHRGSLRVDQGRSLRFRGRIVGDVYVGPGSRLDVLGKIEGNLRVEGGQVELQGDLRGDLCCSSGSIQVVGSHFGGLVLSN